MFNDLLILKHIVPSLTKETIRDLLVELKHHIISKNSEQPLSVNLEIVLEILQIVDRPSLLLTDCLACSESYILKTTSINDN